MDYSTDEFLKKLKKASPDDIKKDSSNEKFKRRTSFKSMMPTMEEPSGQMKLPFKKGGSVKGKSVPQSQKKNRKKI